MYIAQKIINGRTAFVLRESVPECGPMGFRDLFELGTDPSRFIVYPGGNAYHIDAVIEETLDDMDIQPDPDALDDLFWPYVRPDIRRAVEAFRHRSRSGPNRKMTADEAEAIRLNVHPFDKRRVNFLKFGHMDQGPVSRMPPALFKHLAGKSRDEIEQTFMRHESVLNATELKTYAYVALDIQRFFSNFMAKKMPHVLDQDAVDSHFVEELCRVNRTLFRGDDTDSHGGLHEYLFRYVIMFFDNEYENTTLLDEFSDDFMNRRRFFNSVPPAKSVSLDKAACIFGVKKETLQAISRKGLTRLYRRIALTCHPDKGGSNEQFVELTEAYQSMLRKIGKN